MFPLGDVHDVSFLYPSILLGLLLLPLLAWWLGRPGPVPSLAVPSLHGLSELGRIPRRHSGRWRWALMLLPLGLMIVALARPRQPRDDLPDPSKGIDIMLTLDFSRSMAEPDFRGVDRKRMTRRDALVKVVSNFVTNRPNDRIGIVCFARNPYLISPLTLDHGWALNSLAQTDLMTGTGIGEAIVASVRFLTRDSKRSKIIILVTDGDNSAGRRPIEVVQYPMHEHIKVYTILIGPEIVTPTAAANHELNKVARLTGGQFFQAVDVKGLTGIYAVIDQLEKMELVQKRHVMWRELFPQAVTAALGLLAVETIFFQILRRRIP